MPPAPAHKAGNPFAIERPHATVSMLQRQGSFRGFSQLNQASPFKRQLSLRLGDLPSNLERQRSLSLASSEPPARAQPARPARPPGGCGSRCGCARCAPEGGLRGEERGLRRGLPLELGPRADLRAIIPFRQQKGSHRAWGP